MGSVVSWALAGRRAVPVSRVVLQVYPGCTYSGHARVYILRSCQGVLSLVSEARCTRPGVRGQVSEAWCPSLGVRGLVSEPWCPSLGVRGLVSELD